MGNGPKQKKPGSRSKIKKYKRSCSTKHRAKDIDQIQDEIKLAKSKGDKNLTSLQQVDFDEDLPGGGQFYVWETNRHFADERSMKEVRRRQNVSRRRAPNSEYTLTRFACRLLQHKRTREYKRRVKQLKEEKYDPDWAAGITKEKLPPAHPPKK